ncbi:CDP-6-deoxy-delta-3,4-glucoseen reductase [Comamonas kerstersii]|uniref:CDP-6-deoxy-delta-3,4-glucoseen reductase n=1 Tax=Comamonas kerstersii TaxID=225992 RepID=A0A0W7Z211_9BURK|nr:CDP-6-deoxy-delta-3,4-glucoseen reductase [Comamonas kerstersii]AQZ99914.1 CDP-6-deoxy-delta-3,4-glucoseen reductase [Comamonas kerstersii]KUF41262.1 CDP-6-deoxy-delta-3,4-glucoseen reductase [Comamonas kerstersii]OOH86067.1 CDP-6-deoxy-delta-3,4-glucoseen reductase [Comamonas kerstersii]OOH93559.1 CDP-6-deoxy-delta-3,4-glucoseen reductase [Comamonas kerstersii]
MNASTFQITVEPSGRQFSASGQETILAAAIHAGVGLPYGCKDGACGSCKCKKLSGEVTHDAYSENALSEAELAAGLILTCRATATSDVVLESRQVTGANAFPIKKMPVRVNALEKLSHDVMRVQLQLPAHTAFQFHAGQYLEFILRDGSRRAYSMATPPHVAANTPAIELHIRHMPGGKFTDHVFGAMKEKEILRAEGPFGSFFLREDSDKPMVFLASGTGFAPIKALLEHMQHKVMTRPVSLYWGGRRPEDLYMDAWLKELSTSMPNLSYVPVISDALPEDHWSGRTGYVHQAVLDDFADLSGHEVYACGAPVVVDAARSSYTSQRGLPEECFFADAFTSEADK